MTIHAYSKNGCLKELLTKHDILKFKCGRDIGLAFLLKRKTERRYERKDKNRTGHVKHLLMFKFTINRHSHQKQKNPNAFPLRIIIKIGIIGVFKSLCLKIKSLLK